MPPLQHARKIRDCYEELKDVVGPWGDKKRDLRVLKNGTHSLVVRPEV